MTLNNKLNLTDSRERAYQEELLSKRRALELYDKKSLILLKWGRLKDYRPSTNTCSRIFMISQGS